MTVRKLIELLRHAPPGAVVTTWDPNYAVDSDVEEVHLVDGPTGPVLVLGLDMDGLGASEVLWGAK